MNKNNVTFLQNIYMFLYNFISHMKVIFALMVCANLIFIIWYVSEFQQQIYIRPTKGIYHTYRADDVSCYRQEEIDFESHYNLPPINESVTHDKRIFFLETSCKGGLDSKQACAIESAVRMNPDWRIEVVFFSPPHVDFLRGDLFKSLQNPNLFYSRATFTDFVQGTPITHLVDSEEWVKVVARDPVKHASELLRLAALWKYGGMYLDLDTLTVNSFENLPDTWVARISNEQKRQLSSGAFKIRNDELGRQFVNETVNNLIKFNNNQIKSSTLSSWLEAACETICPEVNFSKALWCKSIAFIDDLFFQESASIAKYLKPVHDVTADVLDNAYVHHIPVPTIDPPLHTKALDDKSTYVLLAKSYCPTVYFVYSDQFGL